jgi:hypothetical protein
MPSTRSSDNTDDWRSSPPYALADGREAGEYTKHTAACFCGAVRWGFSESKPLQAKYCQCVTPFIPAKAPIPADTRHRLALDSCSTCQQLHGAPFQWAAIFRKDHLLFEPDSLDHIGFYDSREKQCHSPLMDEGNNMVRLSPSAARPLNPSRSFVGLLPLSFIRCDSSTAGVERGFVEARHVCVRICIAAERGDSGRVRAHTLRDAPVARVSACRRYSFAQAMASGMFRSRPKIGAVSLASSQWAGRAV